MARSVISYVVYQEAANMACAVIHTCISMGRCGKDVFYR